MAQSYVTFTGNGSSTGPITLGFNYILKAHVKVYEGRDILANTGTLKSETTHYTFNTAGTQISMVTAPANGVIITIERETPNDDQIVPYADGSNLIADSLNNSDKQTLFCTQELEDRQELSAAKADAAKTSADTATSNVTTLTGTQFKSDGTVPMTGNLNAGNNKGINVTDPTSAQDAVTKAFLERTGSIASAQIVDGTIVDGDVNASAAISGSKLQASSGSNAGSMSSAHYTKLENVETNSKDDQTGSEIKSLYEAQSDTNAYTDAEKTKLTSCESNAKDDQTASEIKSLYESNSNTNAITDTEKTNIGTITNKQPLDSELTTLAGMQGATASLLGDSSKTLTSNIDELNLLDGKSVVTSVSGSSTDVQLPTAKAVNDQIVALLQNIGGFYPIDDELKFPNTNPDPNDDAGTIISIDDAGGVVVNGSGVSTTGRTLGGATVTINGFPSTLYSTTIAAAKGLLVQTTTTLNTYTYHRLLTDEAGVSAAQTLVTDFNQRYQVNGSAPTQQPDGTALVEGDLWFDEGSNIMKVYDGSNYAAVTSVGDYKLLTVVPDGATSGSPTFDGNIVSYDLRDGGSGASITSVGQLLVSLNGVLQKPNSGSWSASNEGFHLEGTNGIKFCTAPPSGSSLFVTLIGSATSVNVPATNSVVEAAIQSNVVSEEKLKISNSPTNGKFLQAQSGQTGGMLWADVPAGVGGATGVTFNDDVEVKFGTDGDAVIDYNGIGNGWIFKSSTANSYIHMQPKGIFAVYNDSTVNTEFHSNYVFMHAPKLVIRGEDANTGGRLELCEDSAGLVGYSTIIEGATSLSADWTLKLPAAAPASNGQALTATTAGVASWATVSSTTADGCLYENSQSITNNYTIASGKGAHAVGPLAISATLTINGVLAIS